MGLKIPQKSGQYRIKQTLQNENKSTYIFIYIYISTYILISTEIIYYSNHLEIHKSDSRKSWKIFLKHNWKLLFKFKKKTEI